MKSFLVIILIALALGGGYFYGLQKGQEKIAMEENKEAMENELPVNDMEALPKDSIVGVWQSDVDSKFTRTIYENGGYMDSYGDDEEATTNGSWSTFETANAPENFPYTLEEDATYLKLEDAQEVFFYKIVEKTEEKLTLIYLDRGGALEFTRLP